MMGYISNFFQANNLDVFTQGWGSILPLAILVWSIIWKGIALWKAGRLGQKTWFIVMLIVNTVGILEIIYIFAVARRKEKAGQAPM